MFGVILYQNWKLAAVSLLVIPISSFTMVRMGQRLRSLATRGQERMGDMASTLQETLAGIRIVKAFGREEAEGRRFRYSNEAFLRMTMKAIQVSSLGNSHMEVIRVVGVAAIIWYGGYLVIQGAMPGAFFSFLTAMFMAYTPIRRLSGANNVVQQALSAAERVFTVLDMENERSRDHGLKQLAPISRSLEFRGVTFQYEAVTPLRSRAWISPWRQAKSWRSSEAAGAEKRRWSASFHDSTSRAKVACISMATIFVNTPCSRCARRSAWFHRAQSCSTKRFNTISPMDGRTRRRRILLKPPKPHMPTTSYSVCRTGTRRSSVKWASYRAASDSGWPSRERSCATRLS